MKGALRFIFGLPTTVIGGVLNAESDWIRYGLPAVLLTTIFFVAMRVESPPAQMRALSVNRPTLHAAVIKEGDRSKLSPPMAAGDSTQRTVPLMQQRVDLNQRQRPAPSAANVANNAPHTEGAAADPAEARRSLCIAVGLASKITPNRRKARALRFAIAGYRGKGNFQVAERAVNDAISDYTAGKWSEAQCPPDPDGSRLPKGAIGEAVK